MTIVPNSIAPASINALLNVNDNYGNGSYRRIKKDSFHWYREFIKKQHKRATR